MAPQFVHLALDPHSLGLLRMGSHIRALPGGTARMLQGSKIRHRNRASDEISPVFYQGGNHVFPDEFCLLALRRLMKMLSTSQMQAHSRTRTLPCLDLMEHLPALQQLLFRLKGCQVWSFHVLLLSSSKLSESIRLTCFHHCSLNVQHAQITLSNMR
jgi:hypothetical protein